MKYINLEYHPADSRIRMVDEDICQTLNQRMGTGGGNVPLILEIHDYSDRDRLIQPMHYRGGIEDAEFYTE